MADIEPFRHHKRLKSLDELDGPVWKIDTLPPKPISPVWLVVGGLLTGVGIGLVLIAFF